MNERKCSECNKMVKIINDYCYRNIFGLPCSMERSGVCEYYMPGYEFCGPEAKFFERKKQQYY